MLDLKLERLTPPKPIISGILLICFSFVITEIGGFKEYRSISLEQHNILRVSGFEVAAGNGMTWQGASPTISQGKEVNYKSNLSQSYMHQKPESIFKNPKGSAGSGTIRPAGLLLVVCFLFLISCCWWEVSAKKMNIFTEENEDLGHLTVNFAARSSGGDDYGDGVYRPSEYSIPASAENGNSVATTFTANWVIAIPTTSFLLCLLPVFLFL